MSKNLLLWISAFVIVFLFTLVRPYIRGEQPVSGTIGIEGKKISYLFPREWEAGTDLKFLIRNDNPKVTGYYVINLPDGKKVKKELTVGKEELIGVLPAAKPGESVDYTVFLKYDDKQTQIPYNTTLTTVFTGKVSLIIKIFYPLMLFILSLLAVRGGLEFFNEEGRYKLYTIFTAGAAVCLSFIIVPVRNLLLIAPPAGTIPPPGDMFTAETFFYSVLWVLVSILVFFNIKPGFTLLVGSMFTLAGLLFI
ncbi:MAG: hypothetical protein LC102_10080 [Ignavibacteriales bacterium]|nr:MAG: hypothetical protein F9K26_12285 [Ignavibacteriaceae bacterium]MBW7872128.1 hypothetical protein [Ignavibacteria bacterium]MCZ2143762.1 hypothetical protein [Ignavibacteriales bacterium]OQY79491.1 MAG: hypothetical protein B6D45_00750 [Ignavibacteriales bacterium UTCHB3]MBV6445978.1 hypothetical protein [Ignavibacteriaceae bacterium]